MNENSTVAKWQRLARNPGLAGVCPSPIAPYSLSGSAERSQPPVMVCILEGGAGAARSVRKQEVLVCGAPAL